MDIACAEQIAVMRDECQLDRRSFLRSGLAYGLLPPTVMKRTLFSVALVGVGVVALGGFENGDGVPQPPAKEWAARNDALTRARIFRDEPFDAASIDFAADPNRGVVDPTLTSCKYKPDEVSGTTPKFDCELPNGEKIKVKYGWTQEIPSETAATRLLHALGFGADRVSRVETVRCYGCPFQPFHTRALLEMLNVDGILRQTDRLLVPSRLQEGQRRAQSRRRSHRGRRRARMGVLRARQDRSVARRRDACRSRRAPADGDLPAPLGQQVVEPAIDVREREDGRLRASARDDSGCRLGVRSEESRPRQLAIEARLAWMRRSVWCR